MPVRVVHFGVDRCKRLPVLRSAGYAIDDCTTLARLDSVVQPTRRPAAILLSEGEGQWRQAVTLIRSRPCHSPLILFQESPSCECGESELDLVIPPFTSPRAWLEGITGTIERSCALRAASEALRADSELVRQQCESIRQKLRESRARNGLVLDQIEAIFGPPEPEES